MPSENILTRVSGAADFRIGEVVHVIGNRQVARAQANAPASVKGAIGLSLGWTAIFDGVFPVILEAGLTPNAQDTLWVSAITPGRATNVQPALARLVGTILDASRYTIDGTVVVVLAESAEAAGAAGTLDSTLVHVSKFGSDTTGTGSEEQPFLTVQKGVDVASLGPWTFANGAVVLVRPGTYDEDVVLKRSNVNIVGVGGQGVVKLKSLTITDCTDASLALFNASGDPTLLVRDVAIASPPTNTQIREIEIERGTNVPAWTGDAIASLRALGGATPGTNFLGSELLSWHVSIRQAAGAAAGKGGLYAAHANYVSFEDSWVSGGCKTYQTAGLWFDFVTAVGSPGGGVGTVETFYDPASVEPSDSGNYGFNMNGGRVAKILLTGPAGRCGQDYLEGATIGEIDCNATTAASASILHNCHVKGAIDLAVVGPTIIFNGGRFMVAPSGLGAAGFTSVPGFGS